VCPTPEPCPELGEFGPAGEAFLKDERRAPHAPGARTRAESSSNDISTTTGAAEAARSRAARTEEHRADAGWTIIALLRHRPGLPTSIQLASGIVDLDREKWSRSEGWCEHCRTRRARRSTYPLRHRDGCLLQVGANCIGRFIGGPAYPPRTPASHRGTMQRALPDAQTIDYVDTFAYLAQVAQAVLDEGFVSTAAGTRHRPATWVRAASGLDLGHPPGTRAARRAHEALAWARDDLAHRGQLDDFERRLLDVVTLDRLTRRELPTAAALIRAYHRELQRMITARQGTDEPASEHGAQR